MNFVYYNFPVFFFFFYRNKTVFPCSPVSGTSHILEESLAQWVSEWGGTSAQARVLLGSFEPECSIKGAHTCTAQ